MSQLVWGAPGTRQYETGIDRGVLYPPNNAAGVAWSGLTSVDEKPSGGDPQPYYIDGVKYLQIASAEEYEASIAAFSAPAEFGVCDGTASVYGGLFITQQPRKQFGFAYRNLIGNDVDGEGHGYKLHLVYNALAKPTSRSNTSLSDSSDPMDLSWDISCVPPAIQGFKPSAHLVINSLLTDPAVLAAIETILYGATGIAPRLPLPAELMTIFGAPAPSSGSSGGSTGGSNGGGTTTPTPAAVTTSDNNDGTVTYSGSGVTDNGDGTFTANDSTVTDNGDGTYTSTY